MYIAQALYIKLEFRTLPVTHLSLPPSLPLPLPLPDGSVLHKEESDKEDVIDMNKRMVEEIVLATREFYRKYKRRMKISRWWSAKKSLMI